MKTPSLKTQKKLPLQPGESSSDEMPKCWRVQISEWYRVAMSVRNDERYLWSESARWMCCLKRAEERVHVLGRKQLRTVPAVWVLGGRGRRNAGVVSAQAVFASMMCVAEQGWSVPLSLPLLLPQARALHRQKAQKWQRPGPQYTPQVSKHKIFRVCNNCYSD